MFWILDHFKFRIFQFELRLQHRTLVEKYNSGPDHWVLTILSLSDPKTQKSECTDSFIPPAARCLNEEEMRSVFGSQEIVMWFLTAHRQVRQSTQPHPTLPRLLLSLHKLYPSFGNGEQRKEGWKGGAFLFSASRMLLSCVPDGFVICCFSVCCHLLFLYSTAFSFYHLDIMTEVLQAQGCSSLWQSYLELWF